jgi:23S rRNA pseudouridine1911/1915/1917 synthase
MGERTLTVGESAGGLPRLDGFVAAALPGLSRRLVRRLIAAGGVRVNGRVAAKGTRLRPGDRVTLPELPAGLAPEPGLALPVVYEDVSLAALDKPGGLPAHALDPRQRGTAAAFVLARYPETAGLGDPLAPGLVHRLDTGTSGLLVVARTAGAYAALRRAFRAHAVEKRYLALVAGAEMAWRETLIDVPLAHDPRDRRRMVPAPPGTRAWRAETRVAVVARGRQHALVAATIRTGVTHQVRAHLAVAGHPVLNDRLYGGPLTATLAPGRHALHATALTLPHPTERRRLALTCPLPPDLAALGTEAGAFGEG